MTPISRESLDEDPIYQLHRTNCASVDDYAPTPCSCDGPALVATLRRVFDLRDDWRSRLGPHDEGEQLAAVCRFLDAALEGTQTEAEPTYSGGTVVDWPETPEPPTGSIVITEQNQHLVAWKRYGNSWTAGHLGVSNVQWDEVTADRAVLDVFTPGATTDNARAALDRILALCDSIESQVTSVHHDTIPIAWVRNTIKGES